MNLNYPNLDYPFGCAVDLFPEEAAAEREQEIVRRNHHYTAKRCGDWHYSAVKRGRWVKFMAIAVSVGFHSVFLLGFNTHVRPKAVAITTGIEVSLIEMPEKLKDLDDSKDDSTDVPVEAAAGAPAPMLPDVPSVVLDGSFIQEVDTSTFLPHPNLDGAKLSTIPTLVRNGGQGGSADKLRGIFDLASLDRAPNPIYQAIPVVPASLRNREAGVKVVVGFIVTAKGDVIEPYVLESDVREFEEPALRGVVKWKFKPGIKNGRKVATRIQQPILFRVRGD